MRTYVKYLSALAGLTLGAGAPAGVLVSVDVNSATADIDSLWQASGIPRTVNLVIELETASDSLSGYAFSVASTTSS